MTESELREHVRHRVEQVLDILAHISFGNLALSVPALPEEDAFADLFAGLEVLLADLREDRDELEAQVRERTRELEADIRQRQQVEAQLRTSEATYRMLVETSPDPLMLCDSQGRVSMANPALLRAMGVASQAELLGAAWLDFVVPEDRARAADCATTAQGGSRVCGTEVRLRRQDGSELVAELRCSAVRDPSGATTGVLSVLRDVTGQRRREREQLRAEQLESLGTLAGGIAHDFNNCLAAIVGCLSLARNLVRHTPDAQSLIEDAVEASFRATALTRQLLTFSTGGLPVKACLDIGGLLERVADFCVRGSNVKCAVELDAHLWPVEVDSGQFEQAFSNLVINAKQAMPGGGTIAVRAGNTLVAHPESPDDRRRYVRISVADTGIGIPPDALHRIYDPYFSTKEGGSGLGLATAYSVVHKHGGFLECESTVGQGSTFHIHLPASDRQPDAAPSSLAAAQRGHGRILVMDDEEQLRAVAARQLRQAGYEVVTVASGTAALAAYQEARVEGRPFAAVLMDLTVPGGDGGKETMPRLLALDPAARGIVVSGYSDDPVLADYEKHGFCARLAKPYRTEQLLHVVASVMRE
ncbi:MAG: PAS domain S-box protein [Deltaproteobacteria bacterium]|nr:PAS domain S-box protein [Deltaproteobacteria bacterium]